MRSIPMTRFLADLVKVLLLLVCTGVALYIVDPANVVVFQSFGIAVFMVGGTHLTRRILFHKLDLQQIALEAVAKHSIPAAIVFASICGVIVAIMFLGMRVIR